MNPYAAPVEDSDTPVDSPRQTYLRPLACILNALLWLPIGFLVLYTVIRLVRQAYGEPTGIYHNMTDFEVACAFGWELLKVLALVAVCACQLAWTESLYDKKARE